MAHLFEDTKTAFQMKSDGDLKKARFLFNMLAKPVMTKLGAWFFKIPFATNIPFVKPLVRNTIYAHFVGGETAKSCLKVSGELYKYHVSSIMDYSVEGQESEEDFDRVRDEILGLIKIAKENPKEIPFVVFKPTGFGSIDIFEKVGLNAPMSDQEKLKWEHVKQRIDAVCKAGYENDVTIMVDAEHSWMQDAADDLVEGLMRKYNKERCVVVNTVQMYRHDRLAHLKEMHKKSIEGNFFIGYKVVRGAYMEIERERAKEKGYQDPIQPDKASTDRDFDLAVKYIVDHIDKISLFNGTHNEHSCELLTQHMTEKNLPKDYHKIWFGQLYGMSDNISFNLGSMGYNVAKYLPYGPIKDVMPYLIRRAEENTSVAGQTGRELSLIQKEMKRRKQG